jgi:hypothetical protein
MRKQIAVLAALAVAAGACTDGNTGISPDVDVRLSSGVSERNVAPSSYSGNFVASDDDQVCYELSALGYIGEVTGEMYGFKIDPPASFSNSWVNFILSANGRYLDWTSEANATVLAVVVKGGPSYHVYDYVGTGFAWDNGLHSPMNKKSLPQISHYNVCYERDGGDGEGCTPGYWRNHADRWVGVSSADDFDTTFGVDLFDPNVTLGWAIWASGGGNNAFARHATAALLNAHAKADGSLDQFVDYPYTVAVVIQMVQDAVANDTIEATKNLFEAANELGCPLSGTRVVPVS